MYSPPQFSPSRSSSSSFIQPSFSFGFNDEMNFSSIPVFHHYFTTPLNPPTTANYKLMLSPKSTPTNILHPNDVHEYCPRSSTSQLNILPTRKKQSITHKKDRNCKIVTAHGVRDRRVRLSIDIARRFFDLQDSLGFDRASQTLDWLLIKSRTAIKELQMQNNFKQVIDVEENSKKCEAYVTLNGANEDSDNLVIRAKPRARAREKRLHVVRQMPSDHDSEPFGLLQPIKSCKTCESELFCFCQLNSGASTKKLKPSTVTSDYLEMNSYSNFPSGDLHDIFGGIHQ